MAVVPAGVYNAKVFSLERERKRGEEGADLLSLVFRNVVVEPVVAVLSLVAKDVELVVAEHALSTAAFHQAAHAPDHRQAVAAAIHQITYEHEPAPLAVPALAVVAKMRDQRVENLELAVDIADHVDRARRQPANQHRGR